MICNTALEFLVPAIDMWDFASSAAATVVAAVSVSVSAAAVVAVSAAAVVAAVYYHPCFFRSLCHAAVIVRERPNAKIC